VEVTKALSALKPLYGKDNVEVVTDDGRRVRGIVRSMKTTQALTKPSVKIERSDGEIIKIAFSDVVEIIDHNPPTDDGQTEDDER
jgi:small nuclear ribonucleoprotein (snRNP)-like protein